MKKFIIRVLAILSPFAAIVATLVFSAYKTEIGVLKNDLQCPTNIVAAVIGDSRVEVYFDPEVLPWMRNFGLSATPISITAHKARLVAEQNPHLKCIIIDVWPSKFFSTLKKPFTEAVPDSASLIELMTRQDMPPFGEGFETRVSSGVLKPAISHILRGRDDAKSGLTGGFFENKKSLVERLKSSDEYDTPFGPPRTPWQLKATPTDGEIVLEHLIKDLKAKGVNVVLTTTPMLWCDKRYSVEARLYFERRMHEISVEYGIPWFNWMNDYQNELNLWADGLHMNEIGAKVFSEDKRIILETYLRNLPLTPYPRGLPRPPRRRERVQQSDR